MVANHECHQEENIGKFKEFMNNTKGLKATLFTISITILLQVGTFLYLWGGLTTTVNKNTDYLWNDLSPKTLENTRNIDRILAKMDSIRFVTSAEAKEAIKKNINLLNQDNGTDYDF